MTPTCYRVTASGALESLEPTPEEEAAQRVVDAHNVAALAFRAGDTARWRRLAFQIARPPRPSTALRAPVAASRPREGRTTRRVASRASPGEDGGEPPPLDWPRRDSRGLRPVRESWFGVLAVVVARAIERERAA